MLRSSHIQKALTQQVRDDVEQLKKMHEEMDKLRSAYKRYRDLESEARTKEDRIQSAMLITDSSIDPKQMQGMQEIGVNLEITLGEIPLWKMLREIVRQVSQIQVVEIEQVLKESDIKVSRAAIESALKTHKDVFRTVLKGREKYVSLKGA